jgi:hypothetical protein
MSFSLEISELPFVEFSNLKNLPSCPAIYFAFDSENILHYVGKAENLQARWKNHHRKFQLEQIDKKYPIRIFWLVWNEDDLTTAEKYFIEHYKPLLNTTKVETSPIIPSEVILKQLLKKIARKIFAIGIVKGTKTKLTTIYIKYDARDYTSKGAAAIIKKFQAENKQTGLKIKRSRYVKEMRGIFYPIGSREHRRQAKENRAYNNHWEIGCNGIIIDITPVIGIYELDFLNQKSIAWKAADIKIRAILQPHFTEMTNNHRSIVQGLPLLSALEIKNDPIPLFWKDWKSSVKIS